MECFKHFISLFNDSALWLLLGLIISVFIKAFISKNYLTQHLGNTGFLTIIKAAFIGAPLPICSCGVVPIAIAIRRAGGSKNASVAFLISTPETGIDSVTVTYALMGSFMAIIRPIAAICSAIVAGLLVGNEDNKQSEILSKEGGCCHPNSKDHNTFKNYSKKTSKQSLVQKLQQGFKFSFIDILDDIVVWLLIGIGFTALIQTFVPTSFFSQWGSSWVAFVLMALIGVPMYICATASTPIAAGLLLSGVSPGAVLVFMLLGPATNIGTVGIILKELGKKSVFGYLAGVVITSFVFGAFTNYLISYFNISILSIVQNHNLSTSNLTILCSIVMAVLCAISLCKKLMKKTP